MRINTLIYDTMVQHNNVITTSKVIELGFSKMLLTKYVQEGLIIRVRRGTYSLSNEIHDDMFTMMMRSEKLVFSHDSALFLNGLSDRTPFMHSVTIPLDCSLPSSIKNECNCFYVKPELHNLGLITRKTAMDNEVRCYNPERTICDIVRSRNRIDEETYVMAIRNYAKSTQKNLKLLANYATKFRILNKIQQIFEILI